MPEGYKALRNKLNAASLALKDADDTKHNLNNIKKKLIRYGDSAVELECSNEVELTHGQVLQVYW
jgi:hypothetical protein